MSSCNVGKSKEKIVDAPAAETVHSDIPDVPLEGTRPDAATKQYRSKTRDGLLVFRTQFLRSEIDPPCDVIRKLLTEIEFEGQIEDGEAVTIEAKLQAIEAQLDVIRLAIRNMDNVK